MNIILIGFMGAGKTTVGRKLANRLGYFFLDTDQQIEIFAQKHIDQNNTEDEVFSSSSFFLSDRELKSKTIPITALFLTHDNEETMDWKKTAVILIGYQKDYFAGDGIQRKNMFTIKLLFHNGSRRSAI